MILDCCSFSVKRSYGTFEQAIWKPVEAMNSIWEIVCHLLFYEKRFLGETENEPQAEDNDCIPK